MKRDYLSIFYDPLLKANVLEALKDSIRAHEDEIMDLNKQQLDRGLDAKGKSLGEYASFAYKGRWKPVDLKNEGDFRDEFSIEITNRHSEIFSQNWKDEKLRKRYGKDIYGISAPMINNVQDIIRQTFVNNYRKQILNK